MLYANMVKFPSKAGSEISLKFHSELNEIEDDSEVFEHPCIQEFLDYKWR